MALEDVLSAPVVRPVILGYLDIAGIPLYGWTGNGALIPTGTGDSLLDNNVFLEAEGAVQLSDIVDNQGIGGPLQISFTVDELGFVGITLWDGSPLLTWNAQNVQIGSVSIFQRLVQDRRAFLGRRVALWLGFLTEDESAILPEIDRIYTGVMVGADTDRQTGQPHMLTLHCDQDLQGAQGPGLRWIDHQTYVPGDSWSTFINDMSRGGIATGSNTRDWMTPHVNPYTDDDVFHWYHQNM